MAVVKFKTTLKTTILTSILTALDAATPAAYIEIYSGPMPATPETAISGNTLLGTLTCSVTSGVVSGATLTFNAITSDAAADATGIAEWARFKDGTGVAIIDVDITSTAGTGAMRLNTTSIVTGGPITCSSIVISVA